MCTVCGCGTSSLEQKEAQGHEHASTHRHHDHDHFHEHSHDGDKASIIEGATVDFGAGPAGAHVTGLSQERIIRIERDILAKNNDYAARNRARFAQTRIFTLNLVSSPGSGKTSLLVRTIEELRGRFPIRVIEGDQQTANDADRIRRAGAPAVQINTGKGCHLDAHMVGHGLETLKLEEGGLLFIENVGNLVCPAAFDLGEAHKVVVLSVTEGEDKPLKYPQMFAASNLMLLNKADLLPHLDFDVGECVANALRINPDIQTLLVSAKTGEGLTAFYAWLESHAARWARANTPTAVAE